MQLAQLLKAAGLGVFPCAVSFDQAKQKWSKHPVTVNHEAWAATAARPIDDPSVSWNGCRVLGVPVPPGVVIIDLDTYRPGCTTGTADALLGVKMPWAHALIQTTISGGSHYAFRAPAGWTVRQGDNLGGAGSGVDTRVGGKGFICSGDGYAPAGAFGLLRLAYPESLPELPDACRPLLEHVTAERPTPELPDSVDRDLDTIRAALEYVDPSTRDMWRDVGFSLKHQFHDDEETGFALWDAWSRGEFWADGCPPSYNADTQWHQWGSFRAVRDGATITLGTLFHHAMAGGWRPPAQFDTSVAFGADAAPADAFNALVDRIIEDGSDSKKTSELIDAIRASGCNVLQTLLLRNQLKAMMRDARVLDKTLSAEIDRSTGTPSTPTASNTYSKNHTENAQLFLQTNFPNNSLMRVDEVWYAYTGPAWSEINDAALMHRLAAAMAPSLPQSSDLSGTYSVLASLTYREGVRMNTPGSSQIVYQNGVLDLFSGTLLPHGPQYLTTNVLPYRHAPGSAPGNWLLFLQDVFEGDGERIELLQEWMGYMLSPTYQYQKIMLMLGPKRSGKGTIGRVMRALVGDLNYTGAALESFADDDFLDSLRGKTVAFSGDTAKNINRNRIERVIERIKKISGCDEVDFGRKYKSRMTATLPTRLTLAANHIPRLFDDSEALSHRMLVLPFDVSFADREDPYLINMLLAEIEGIAAWALQGLARLNARGRFTVPEASRSEMEFITESYSPVSGFIKTCCDIGRHGERTLPKDLYDAYRAWALAEQEPHILARKTFISTFKDATRGTGCRYGSMRDGDTVFKGFQGVRLQDGAQSVTAGAFQPTIVK